MTCGMQDSALAMLTNTIGGAVMFNDTSPAGNTADAVAGKIAEAVTCAGCALTLRLTPLLALLCQLSTCLIAEA